MTSGFFTSIVFPLEGNSLIAAEYYGDIYIYELTDYLPKNLIGKSDLFGWGIVLALSPNGIATREEQNNTAFLKSENEG